MNKLEINKNIGLKHNVTLRVLDADTGEVIQEHEGHNMATNSMLTGIGHYLIGDGVLNQGWEMLSKYVPKYISLGTMGLINQDEDENGLPAGIGEATSPDVPQEIIDEYNDALEALSEAQTQYDTIICCKCPFAIMIRESEECKSCEYFNTQIEGIQTAYEEALNRFIAAKQALESYDEPRRFQDYMLQAPGFGADGYDEFENNNRTYMGLGPVYKDRPDKSKTVQCELISSDVPRVSISFRDVVPEIEAELPKTIDIVFSAMISTGALRKFREEGKPYIFITECGLWANKTWPTMSDGDTINYDVGDNGLLAGYRIIPPNDSNWDMTIPHNRYILKQNILKVGINQVVQVIWKIQLGSLSQLDSSRTEYVHILDDSTWTVI